MSRPGGARASGWRAVASGCKRRREKPSLKQPGGPVEVVNAAYPGLTIATSNRRLSQTLGLLHPRAVVVYPSFTSYISLARVTAAPMVTAQKDPPELRLSGRVATLIKSALPERVQDYLRRLEIRITDRDVTVSERLPQANIDRFEADLDRLVSGIRESGASAVLVTHATRFGAFVTADQRPYLVAWRKFFPTLKEEGFLDMEQRMNQAVANVARRHGVTLVDAAAQLEPGPKNFVEFVHFTDEGARSLAALVAEGIKPVIGASGDSIVHQAQLAPEQKGLRP